MIGQKKQQKKYDTMNRETRRIEGDGSVPRSLAYVHMNNIEQAKKIAQSSINNGNRGNYENDGKTFFEWMLMVYQTYLYKPK